MYQPAEEGLWCVASAATYTGGHQQANSGATQLHQAAATMAPGTQQPHSHLHSQSNQTHHHHSQQQQQQQHHHHPHNHHPQHEQQLSQHHTQLNTNTTITNNNSNSSGTYQQYGGTHTIDSSTHGQGKKSIDKGSDEYKKRRERNNVAVRKSREKAKMRSRETERRVAELSKENQLFRARYEELLREFNVLKSVLLKTGLTEQVIEDEAQRHAMQQQISQVSNNVHNHMVVSGNHHIVSTLNQHVGLKGVNCNQVSNTISQPHYTGASLEAVDQWTDGVTAYVDDWAS